MKTSGWFDSEIDDAPRMRMVRDVPAVPDAALTATPGRPDYSNSFTLLIGACFLMSAAERDETVAGLRLAPDFQLFP